MGLAAEVRAEGSRASLTEQLRNLAMSTVFSPRVIAIVTILVVWQILAVRMNTRVLPTPMKVMTTTWGILASGVFFTQLAASMVRILAGFSVTVIVGTTVGVLMGSRRSWETFFQDIVVLGLALPGLIYALLSVMFFGLSLAAPLLAILGTSYPFFAVNVREGVKVLDKDLLDMGRVYHVGRWRVIREVILPSLLPFFLAAIRVSFAVAWKVNTLVEVFGATNGVGYMIRGSFDAFAVHGILAWALLFGGVMLVIEYGILLPAERYFARWRPKVGKVV